MANNDLVLTPWGVSRAMGVEWLRRDFTGLSLSIVEGVGSGD